MLYVFATFIPFVAVSVRRLHDTNRSGWWCLLVLIPLVGFIPALIFMAEDSQPGDNRYGPNPKMDSTGNIVFRSNMMMFPASPSVMKPRFSSGTRVTP